MTGALDQLPSAGQAILRQLVGAVVQCFALVTGTVYGLKSPLAGCQPSLQYMIAPELAAVVQAGSMLCNKRCW